MQEAIHYEKKADIVKKFLKENPELMGQNELANLIGVRKDTLSRALNPAAPSGVVNMAYNRIKKMIAK